MAKTWTQEEVERLKARDDAALEVCATGTPHPIVAEHIRALWADTGPAAFLKMAANTIASQQKELAERTRERDESRAERETYRKMWDAESSVQGKRQRVLVETEMKLEAARAALKAVTPYAESRAEDMSASAAQAPLDLESQALAEKAWTVVRTALEATK